MNADFVDDILPPEVKEHETSALILGQMRNGPIPRHKTDIALLTHFADRLEKAIKKEIAEAEVENAVLPAVDISKIANNDGSELRRALAGAASAIDGILKSYAIIDEEPSLKMNLETIIHNIESVLANNHLR